MDNLGFILGLCWGYSLIGVMLGLYLGGSFRMQSVQYDPQRTVLVIRNFPLGCPSKPIKSLRVQGLKLGLSAIQIIIFGP